MAAGVAAVTTEAGAFKSAVNIPVNPYAPDCDCAGSNCVVHQLEKLPPILKLCLPRTRLSVSSSISLRAVVSVGVQLDAPMAAIPAMDMEGIPPTMPFS